VTPRDLDHDDGGEAPCFAHLLDEDHRVGDDVLVMATGETRYGGSRILEVPALHRDGHTLSIAFTVTLLHRPGERRPFAIAAVVRDDTERWQERREVREKVATLEARQAAT
jgi:hypothetical protein